MAGCLKSTFAMVGCLVFVVLGGIAGWHYRGQIGGAFGSLRGVDGQRGPLPTAAATGGASIVALRSALMKQGAIERPDGPEVIELTPSEMASIIEAGLEPRARDALDSIEVTLHDDRLTLRASVATRILGRELLGPFAAALGEREPLRVSGGPRGVDDGMLAWVPDSFVVRSFPFPGVVIPKLVNTLTGRSDGAIPVSVPRTVRDVRIRPEGVTFYRRGR